MVNWSPLTVTATDSLSLSALNVKLSPSSGSIANKVIVNETSSFVSCGSIAISTGASFTGVTITLTLSIAVSLESSSTLNVNISVPFQFTEAVNVTRYPSILTVISSFPIMVNSRISPSTSSM